MVSFNQVILSPRKKKTKRKISSKLQQNPQKRAVCLRVLTISPKKPNSANRRVVKVSLTHSKIKLTAKIIGESHSLQQHSNVLVRGARIRDLIGVSYSCIRGKFDLTPVQNRKTSRSCFGVKKLK